MCKNHIYILVSIGTIVLRGCGLYTHTCTTPVRKDTCPTDSVGMVLQNCIQAKLSKLRPTAKGLICLDLLKMFGQGKKLSQMVV